MEPTKRRFLQVTHRSHNMSGPNILERLVTSFLLNKVSAEASQPHAAQAVPDDMSSLHSICAAAITSSAEHITRKIF